MKNKLIVVALLGVFALGLSACGQNDKQDKASSPLAYPAEKSTSDAMRIDKKDTKTMKQNESTNNQDQSTQQAGPAEKLGKKVDENVNKAKQQLQNLMQPDNKTADKPAQSDSSNSN